MEDEKLAAYYDDLTRRGGGAARFKQGLGFSSNNSSATGDVPSRGSALPTTSTFLSSFVKASSPSKISDFEKQAQLQSIQNKLSRKAKEKTRSRSPRRNSSRRSRSRSPNRDRIRDKHPKRRSRSQSPSRDRIRDNHSKRRSRSRSRSRDRCSRRRSRSRSRDGQSRRSRSRSREDRSRRKYRSRSRSRDKNSETSKMRKLPEDRKSDKVRGGGGIDFAKVIDGYENMTPAERVKAKTKLQLSRTAENDEAIGKGSGWERFDFNRDAPLDEEEIEAAEDDLELVKHMGQSFRFSAVEARKEEEMKAVHDEAMFGAPAHPPPAETEEEAQNKSHKNENDKRAPVTNLLSDQILSMQKKGSWRDRARKT